MVEQHLEEKIVNYVFRWTISMCGRFNEIHVSMKFLFFLAGCWLYTHQGTIRK